METQTKNWWNKYSEERPCELCGTVYTARSKVAKYCPECRVKRNKENAKINKEKRKLRLLKGLPPKKLAKIEICYWCLGGCKVGKECPDCGTPYDKDKALVAFRRQTTSYVDIVTHNAKKDGKDPKDEIAKIRRTRSVLGSFGSRQAWEEVDIKIAIFLQKRGLMKTYNGRPIKPKLKRQK